MKNIVLIILLMNIATASHAQSWQWASNGESTQKSGGFDIKIDKDGNSVVVGQFEGVVFLDTIQLISTGNIDGFIAKYNPSGHIIWAKSFGGVQKDALYGLCINQTGNITICGTYTDSITIGGQQFLSHGASDILLSSLDSSGNLLWTKSFGGSNDDNAQKITVNASGSMFVTGCFSNNGNNGSAQFDSVTLQSYGNGDIFIAMIDNGGNIIWVRGAGGGLTDSGLSVSLDSFDNAYVYGGFLSSTCLFDNYQLNKSSSGFIVGNGFIAKYNSVGNFLWAQGIGGINATGGSTGGELVVYTASGDFYGNSYISGVCRNCYPVFSNITLPESDNIFIAKYDNTGNVTWASQYGNYGSQSGGIVIGSDHTVFLSGLFYGSFQTIKDTLSSHGSSDILLLNIDTLGIPIWAKSVGGSGMDFGVGITVDTVGNVYSTGFFNSPQCDFGNHTVYNNAGNFDMYVAKLSQPPTGVSELSSTNSQLTIYPNPSSGSFYVSYPTSAYSSLTITDALGKAILIQPLPHHQNKHQISLANLADGLYFLRLQGSGNVATGKVWIKK